MEVPFILKNYQIINPVVKITMFEAFPVSLTNIEYSQQMTDTTYAECTATFSYTLFTMTAI